MIALRMNNAPGRRALAPDSRGREARVRARTRRPSTSLFGWIVFLVALLSLFAISYVSETAAATEASYQISKLKADATQLESQQQQIRYQISMASSAGRLDADAGSLGLVRQGQYTYIPATQAPVALNHVDAGAAGAGQGSWLDRLAVAFGRPTEAQAKGR